MPLRPQQRDLLPLGEGQVPTRERHRAHDGCDGAIPPATRNHRDPTGYEIPTSIAASSLDRPAAINAQNRRRCSCIPTPGRPGDLSFARKLRSERRHFVIADTLHHGLATAA
jgi:hypothetical protein